MKARAPADSALVAPASGQKATSRSPEKQSTCEDPLHRAQQQGAIDTSSRFISMHGGDTARVQCSRHTWHPEEPPEITAANTCFMWPERGQSNSVCLKHNQRVENKS